MHISYALIFSIFPTFVVPERYQACQPNNRALFSAAVCKLLFNSGLIVHFVYHCLSQSIGNGACHFDFQLLLKEVLVMKFITSTKKVHLLI